VLQVSRYYLVATKGGYKMSECHKGKIIKKCFIARWTGCPNCNDYLNKNGEPKIIRVGNEKGGGYEH
jgi:hypothetical protein